MLVYVSAIFYCMDLGNAMPPTPLKQLHAKLKPPRTWLQNRDSPMVVHYYDNHNFILSM